MKYLLSWIGATDIKEQKKRLQKNNSPLGPIESVLYAYKSKEVIDRVILLNAYTIEEGNFFASHVNEDYSSKLRLENVDLSSPTSFTEISTIALATCEQIRENDKNAQFLFHISSGTPAMATIWILLGSTRFKGTLLESSVQSGVKEVEFPYDLSAEFLPHLTERRDSMIKLVEPELQNDSTKGGAFIYRSSKMLDVVSKAKHIAQHDIPVLIEGETGTGKEILARFIHRSSDRGEKEFLALNCGALPQALVESELFGYAKGAFTGAQTAKTGLFEAAGTGTLFLDEIGELPTETQVKILRVLQEREVMPLGTTQARQIHCRIISATNRKLLDEVKAQRFRPDLFYRLAIGVLRLPSLRERKGDIGLLIDHFVEEINKKTKSQFENIEDIRFSPSARQALLEYHWPGNIRELQFTIWRCIIWCKTSTVQKEEVIENLFGDHLQSGNPQTKDLPIHINQGFSIETFIDEIKRKYVRQALDQANGTKSDAAKLLGLRSGQVIADWMKRLHIPS